VVTEESWRKNMGAAAEQAKKRKEVGLNAFQSDEAAKRAALDVATRERKQIEAAEEAARLAKKKGVKERSQSRLQIYNDLKTEVARIVVVKAMDETDSIPNNIKIPDLKKRFLNTAWEMRDLKTAATVAIESATTVLHADPLGTNM